MQSKFVGYEAESCIKEEYKSVNGEYACLNGTNVDNICLTTMLKEIEMQNILRQCLPMVNN